MPAKKTAHLNYYKVISALLVSASNIEACKKAGISVGTLYNYEQDPVFQQMLKRASTQLLNGSVGSQQAAMCVSIRDAREIAHDKNVDPSIRLDAVRLIHEVGLRGIELQTMIKEEGAAP